MSYVPGTLSITPVALTILADSKSMIYGGGLPTLTATYSGFVNGDTAANLTTPPTLSTVPANSHVGSYAIMVGGAADPNYTITYVNGTLIITPAILAVLADSKAILYGGTLPALTASYSGFVNGDTAASLTTQPTLSTTATAHSHAGSYAITVGGAADPDYTIFDLNGTLTIIPAPLAIIADSKGMVYGGTLPALTASYSGFVNGDTPASLSTAPTLSTTATAHSHAGSYAVTISGAADPDYTILYLNGTLTISSAPLLIIADSKSMTYGGTLPALTASYSGFVNGDTAASLSTLPTLSSTATAHSHAGNYTISASGAVDPDYFPVYVNGALSITPASLTISADSKSMIYGSPLPALTASYTGLVNGDTAASLTTPATLTTTATTHSHVGNYTITTGAAVDADYIISYVPGTLTITPAALIITADNKSMVFGGILPALTASYSGFVNGDTSASLTTRPTLSSITTVSSHAGSYAITASGATDPDYTITYVNGTFTITPAALTITADNKSMVFGSAVPTLTASFTGFVNGDTAASLGVQPTLSTIATSLSNVGAYPISISGALSPDYTISFVNGTLTITPASTSTTLSSSASGVPFGQAITLTASVTPGIAGSAAVTGTVIFSDQGTLLATVPVNGGTASFTTSSLTVGGHTLSAAYSGDGNHTASSSANVTVTIGTSNERFVTQVYLALLQRLPDASGLAGWVSVLNQGGSRAAVVQGIEQSAEYRADEVQALYQQFLHRAADPTGLSTFVTFLSSGGTLQQVEVILTSSPEYFQVRAGATDAGFITALYQDALHRTPDAGGLTGFMQAMNQGATPQQVASAIFSSQEYLQDLVGGMYQRFLNRPADTAGLNGYVAQLQARVSIDNITAAILGSDEFFGRV
jgi:hypothetical protein